MHLRLSQTSGQHCLLHFLCNDSCGFKEVIQTLLGQHLSNFLIFSGGVELRPYWMFFTICAYFITTSVFVWPLSICVNIETSCFKIPFSFEECEVCVCVCVGVLVYLLALFLGLVSAGVLGRWTGSLSAPFRWVILSWITSLIFLIHSCLASILDALTRRKLVWTHHCKLVVNQYVPVWNRSTESHSCKPFFTYFEHSFIVRGGGSSCPQRKFTWIALNVLSHTQLWRLRDSRGKIFLKMCEFMLLHSCEQKHG